MLKLKPSILIVDDDIRILDLLKQFFSKNNFEVFTAISVEHAEQCLKESKVDLIILDVMLPKINGMEFAKKIKDSGSDMPIIMLTALSDPQDRLRGLKAGANEYISKPFEPSQLLLKVLNLINNYNIEKIN